jgi:hypothetical protein
MAEPPTFDDGQRDLAALALRAYQNSTVFLNVLDRATSS